MTRTVESHIQVQVQVCDAWLRIKLPATVPEKAAEMVQKPAPQPLTGEIQMESWLPLTAYHGYN